MMTRLYVARHAPAGTADLALWPDDALRPLTSSGRRRFRQFFRRLARHGCQPQRVVTSPYLRCVQTARVIAQCCDRAVEERDDLAPGGDLAALLGWITSQTNELILVGHAPDVNELLGRLLGTDGRRFDLRKGAVACVEWPAEIIAGGGVLRWLVSPRMLGF